MTREEAIKQLEEVLNDNESDDGVILGNKDIKAICMAIKALEQTPVIHCRDCKFWQDQEYGVVEVPICARPESKHEKYPFRMMVDGDGFCSYAKR